MNISLLPVDSTYPNLALMKLSAWHKHHGDTVQWYNPLDHYDKVYMAKVFTFTPDYGYYIQADEVEKGGTGYDLHKTLPMEIDRSQPDYSLYPQIDYGNDADILNALLLTILDRTGDDDMQSFRLYNYIKAMPSRLHLELDIDEKSVFGHVLKEIE